jgi:uncharacterized protein YbaP (TraB family)
LSRRILTALLCVLTVALPCTLSAASPNFLWKVTGPRGGTVYLAGSLHLLTKEYYPLASAFDEAFAASDLLIEEIDLGEMESPDAQMLMLRRGMLPAGQTLDAVLTPSTLVAVREKVAALGLPLAPLQLFKPWSLALTLEGMAWQQAGLDPNLGLDKHFYDLAKARGIAVKGLETVDFQLGQFDGLSMAQQDRMLAATLKEMSTAKDSLTELAQAWKAGDVGAIERLARNDFESEPEINQRLLVDRNRNWLPQVEGLFTRPTSSMVIVGAAHLVGPDGLVAQLRARGYTVTQQ